MAEEEKKGRAKITIEIELNEVFMETLKEMPKAIRRFRRAEE